MGCQQVREKQSNQSQQSSKIFIQDSGIRNSHPQIYQNVCLENLQNIRNQEDLAKVIVKKLIAQNELKLSCKLRKKSEDLQDQGKYPEALRVQRRILAIQRQNKTNNDEFAQCLFNIGELELRIKNYEESFRHFRELLDLNNFKDQKSIHIRTLNMINKAAEDLLQQGQLEKALLFKKEVLNYQIYFFGENNDNFQDKVENLREEIKQYEEIFQQILILQSNKELIDPDFFINENECMICCKELNYERTNDQLCISNSHLEKNNITRLKCNHIYHSDCINQWLLKQQNCPYCRSQLKNQKQQDRQEIQLEQQA